MFFSRLVCACAALVFLSQFAVSQRTPDSTQPVPRSSDPIDNISADLGKISKSVDGLTKNWKEFFAAFSTNQGLQLTPRQQRILLALEVLNRGEVRLGNLQKMRMDASEKLSAFRLQLARIENDLLPESIERHVVL